MIAVIMFCLLASPDTAPAQQIYLPIADLINDQIIELQAQGYLQDLGRTERPWLVGDIIDQILAEELTFDPLNKQLARNILEYLEPMRKKDTDMLSSGASAGLGIRGLAREQREGYFITRDQFIDRGYRSEFGSDFSGRFWMSRQARWGVDSKLIFDSDGIGYPWYYGTAHNGRIIGQFDHAYLNFAFDRFTFLFGRQRLLWGPSPRGSLILDDKSPPMDILGYAANIRPIMVSGFISRLDDYRDTLNVVSRRFITGHRLRIIPGKGWEIAIAETYLYGGSERLPELYYSIPVVLFYWEAQNRKQDDNAFWSLDISWAKKRLGHFYIHWVFDDIQRQHRGPQKFAWQLGAHLWPAALPGWSTLIEYNNVDSYVYGQRKRLNAYLNWDRPIARLDSDQREFFAAVNKRINHRMKLGMEFIARDKGEIDAADFQPGMAPFGLPFPFGIVEKTRELSAACSGGISHGIKFALRGGYQSVENWRHQEGVSKSQLVVSFNASYELDFGLPFWKRSR